MTCFIIMRISIWVRWYLYIETVPSYFIIPLLVELEVQGLWFELLAISFGCCHWILIQVPVLYILKTKFHFHSACSTATIVIGRGHTMFIWGGGRFPFPSTIFYVVSSILCLNGHVMTISYCSQYFSGAKVVADSSTFNLGLMKNLQTGLLQTWNYCVLPTGGGTSFTLIFGHFIIKNDKWIMLNVSYTSCFLQKNKSLNPAAHCWRV